jgi:SH3-like domain-containing protein
MSALCVQRHVKAEAAADARVADKIAAMLSRNAAGDCQTEAASLRGWVESDEAFEDSFPVGVRGFPGRCR